MTKKTDTGFSRRSFISGVAGSAAIPEASFVRGVLAGVEGRSSEPKSVRLQTYPRRLSGKALQSVPLSYSLGHVGMMPFQCYGSVRRNLEFR